MKPEEVLKSGATPMKQPPSSILREFYQKLNGKEPSEAMLESVAKRTLLPTNEVCMWLDHLKIVDTNRKRGASKAAETRRHKRNTVQTPSTDPEDL